MPSLADLEYVYLGARGGTFMSLPDRRSQVYTPTQFDYFSARSGLTKWGNSLADHKLAYYRLQTGLTSGSLADAQMAFWSASAPQVTAQPSSAPQSLAVDAVLSLTSAATSTLPSTVQWQRSNNGGSTWADIVGATSGALSHTLSAANGYASTQTWIYRAVWTNAIGSTPSNSSGVVTIL